MPAVGLAGNKIHTFVFEVLLHLLLSKYGLENRSCFPTWARGERGGGSGVPPQVMFPGQHMMQMASRRLNGT